MRVLWVSAYKFDDKQSKGSGGWQKALALKLSQSGQITFGSVYGVNGIDNLVKCELYSMQQWGLPKTKLNKAGIPASITIKSYQGVVNEFNPEIIVVWGAENFLGLLPFENDNNAIKILSFQGVMSSIASNMFKGLNLKELFYILYGPQELYYLKNLLSLKKSFKKSTIIEEFMIRKSNYILSHAEWIDAQIHSKAVNIPIFRTHRALREEFVESQKWMEFQHDNPILFSTAAGYPYKGLHILLKALKILKNDFPNIVLKIAGATGRRDFLASGYIRFLLRIIKKDNLSENVMWLGPLDASGIVDQLQESSVYVHSAFVDSFPNSMAEAMIVGTPSVVTSIGGIPEMALYEKEALFYDPFDYSMCAFQIRKLLNNPVLSKNISRNSVNRAIERNMNFDIVGEQINIYSRVLNN